MKNQILPPKSDVIFKLIFGNSKNKDVLEGFLRSVLSLPEDEYLTLTVGNPQLVSDSADEKIGIVDVKIHTRTGKVIQVEIQLSSFKEMRERILFYTSRLMTEQIPAGKGYDTIKQVICILITDYVLIPENSCYHNRYYLYDEKSGSRFTDLLTINVLELPKLPVEFDGSKLWEWMRFLKISEAEEFDMLPKNDPQIEKAIDILKALSADDETRYIYEQREKARRDWEAMKRSAILDGREEGLKEGLKEGLEEGLKEGLKEGRKEGQKEGRQQALVRVVQKAAEKNVSVSDIAELTGLSPEEIEELL